MPDNNKGKCLSRIYINSSLHLEWCCTKVMASILCRSAGKIHQTLKTAKMIAFNKGGD